MMLSSPEAETNAIVTLKSCSAALLSAALTGAFGFLRTESAMVLS